MQFDYALLHFENLHIQKKVKKLLKRDDYIFTINERFEEVLDKIEKYHEDPWITGNYKLTLKNLKEYKSPNIDFKIFTSEVSDKNTGELIAAEIGYKIGKTYTSLSGYLKKEKKYNNYGKLQIVLLAQYLQKNGFKFLNLGHPYMAYKFELGAKIYDRAEFLELWREARDL